MSNDGTAILPGLKVITPAVHRDTRGYFLETYRTSGCERLGIPHGFVQDNLSVSHRHVLRGLHYQVCRPQDKLVFVVQGRIFDVAVDIRKGSPTFGRWFGMELSDDDHRQLFIPGGFAHGFCVLGDTARVIYKCTDYYAPECERGIRWNDPVIGVAWPLDTPLVSEKDASLPFLDDVPANDLPVCAAGTE